jgi:putative DNA primase/helicase
VNPAIRKHTQDLAQIFIDGLKDGSNHYIQPHEAGDIPPLSYNPVSGAYYRGGNQIALMIAELRMQLQDKNPLGDRRWMTCKQSNSVGARVKRGAKAQLLVACKELEDKRKALAPGEEAPRHLVAFPFFVFHATQIDGLPPPQVFKQRPLDERMAQAQAIVDGLGVPVLSGATQACYVPSKDRILMPDREAFRDDPSWMATLLHECAHATGHETRLNRKFSFDRQGAEYTREELRAELSSFDMCRRLSVPYNPDQHIAYVNSWIELLQKDPSELMRAAADSDKILRFLNVPELVIKKIPTIEQGKEQEKEPERQAEPEIEKPRARKRGRALEIAL